MQLLQAAGAQAGLVAEVRWQALQRVGIGRSGKAPARALARRRGRQAAGVVVAAQGAALGICIQDHGKNCTNMVRQECSSPNQCTSPPKGNGKEKAPMLRITTESLRFCSLFGCNLLFFIIFNALRKCEEYSMRGLSVCLLGAVLLLSGCSISAPGVRAELGDGVHLDLGGGGHGGHGGHFCPPGQAKKGNC